MEEVHAQVLRQEVSGCLQLPLWDSAKKEKKKKGQREKKERGQIFTVVESRWEGSRCSAYCSTFLLYISYAAQQKIGKQKKSQFPHFLRRVRPAGVTP